jgi:acyl carrier protein
MEIDTLKIQIKEHIIKYLNLIDITPADIPDDDPLFKGKLGLDSIDSIELLVMMEREYGIKVTNPAEGRNKFADVNSIAAYILEHSNKK